MKILSHCVQNNLPSTNVQMYRQSLIRETEKLQRECDRWETLEKQSQLPKHGFRFAKIYQTVSTVKVYGSIMYVSALMELAIAPS